MPDREVREMILNEPRQEFLSGFIHADFKNFVMWSDPIKLDKYRNDGMNMKLNGINMNMH